MATSPIYLTEADVGRLVTVKDAIATLEALFATWAQPSTSNLPRQRARLAGGAFNLMGAAYGAKGVHGLKAYAGVKGAQFHALLYSSLDASSRRSSRPICSGRFARAQRAELRPSCWPKRMRIRLPSSALANNRARKSPRCVRSGPSHGSRSSPARPSTARRTRARWKKNSACRRCLHPRRRPAWRRPTWW